jgi:hypothetical protein
VYEQKEPKETNVTKTKEKEIKNENLKIATTKKF